jgi:hypothetical protein
MALSSAEYRVKILDENAPTRIMIGEPTYENINEMVQNLYGNAATLATTLGGGAHGHIGAIMLDALYATLTIVPYNAPNDPGVLAIIPAATSVANREVIRLQHKEERRIYDINQVNMDDDLKGQVIDTVEDPHLCEMKNKCTGYLGVTTRNLLDHLLDRYGKISSVDLKNNNTRMNEPIDSSQPIVIYFKRIDDGLQYATMDVYHTPLPRSYKLPITSSEQPAITTKPAKFGVENPKRQRPGHSSNRIFRKNIMI